jgi:hypothetical protein
MDFQPKRSPQHGPFDADGAPDLGAMIPISALGPLQLRSSKDAPIARHPIWLSRYLYDCTKNVVLSTKMRLGWQRRGPQGGAKSIILKGLGRNLPPMPIRLRHIVTIVALSLAGAALCGCGTINEKLAAGVSDAIPAWAGGVPADAPPRPGTAKYDEFMKERERKRLMPAAERGEEVKSNSKEAIH